MASWTHRSRTPRIGTIDSTSWRGEPDGQYPTDDNGKIDRPRAENLSWIHGDIHCNAMRAMPDGSGRERRGHRGRSGLLPNLLRYLQDADPEPLDRHIPGRRVRQLSD